MELNHEIVKSGHCLPLSKVTSLLPARVVSFVVETDVLWDVRHDQRHGEDDSGSVSRR